MKTQTCKHQGDKYLGKKVPPFSPKWHLRRLWCGNKIGPGYESQEIWKWILKLLQDRCLPILHLISLSWPSAQSNTQKHNVVLCVCSPNICQVWWGGLSNQNYQIFKSRALSKASQCRLPNLTLFLKTGRQGGCRKKDYMIMGEGEILKHRTRAPLLSS